MIATKSGSFDIYPDDESFMRNPHPSLRALRLLAPVYYSQNLKGWLVTGYREVVALLTDKRLSSNRLSASNSERHSQVARSLSLTIAFRDHQSQQRLHQLFSTALSSKKLSGLKNELSTAIHSLVKVLARQPTFDFMESFATVVPRHAIALLLGIPIEQTPNIVAWSEALSGFAGNVDPSEYDIEKAASVLGEANEYFEQLIFAGGLPRGLIPLMLRDAVKAQMATREEVLANALLLVSAGQNTTAHLLGCVFHSLLCHPDVWARMLADESIRDAALEEAIRYDGPSQAVRRVVTQPIEISGKQLHVGDLVMLMINAANRDPAVLQEPDTFNLDRSDRRHLAFGWGPHSCVGSKLARLELRLALDAFLVSAPTAHLAKRPAIWCSNLSIHGMAVLPVAL